MPVGDAAICIGPQSVVGGLEHDRSEYSRHYAVQRIFACNPFSGSGTLLQQCRTLISPPFDAKKKPWRPCRKAWALGL